jgi:hypothetical protein
MDTLYLFLGSFCFFSILILAVTLAFKLHVKVRKLMIEIGVLSIVVAAIGSFFF